MQTLHSKLNSLQFAELGTPFYLYDLDLLRQTLQIVSDESKQFGYQVHYALKANANDELLKVIQQYGMGADCVSGNEIKKALQVGFAPDHVVFAGVGKTDAEITLALLSDIKCFNCESVQELQVIDQIAEKLNRIANIAIRVNPNVNAHTHDYITTGLTENKFGINLWELDEVFDVIGGLKNIKLCGIHMHIGSQITDLNVFRNMCYRVNDLNRWLSEKKFDISYVNVGGGLGVDYHHPDEHPIPDFKSYFAIFNQKLQLKEGMQVHFELGRSLVAQCGNLLTRVLYVKQGIDANFAIVDAGMTDLIRPALYQAYHKIENWSNSDVDKMQPYDVVGPICESSDCFGKGIELPETVRGNFLSIRTAGAYGEVMSSNYNLREKAPSYFVSHGALVMPQEQANEEIQEGSTVLM